jgi:hypothetical protein
LAANPSLFEEKALNVKTLLGCQSLQEAKAAAIAEAIDSSIAERMYGKPEKWFNYLRRNLEAQFVPAEESSFIEMKARRDVLEHHGGLVGAVYLEKARTGAKYGIGDRVEITTPDIDEANAVAHHLMTSVAASAIGCLQKL